MTSSRLSFLALTLLMFGCSEAYESAPASWETSEHSEERVSSDAPADRLDDRRNSAFVDEAPQEIEEERQRQPAPREFEAEVVELVNVVREAGTDCGEHGRFESTAPLDVSGALRAAAQRHSRDMAQKDFMSHEGTDGSRFWLRADEAGYLGSARGENVAGGHPDPETVVEAWLESDSHCMVMMLGDVDEVGVGYVFGDDTTYGHFWTMVVGAR